VTLAHAYGAPEALSILVPLVLFVLILRAGRRRQAEEDTAPQDPATATPADPPVAED
jgi:hypothetical protein